ncbi:hypothetical protein [Paludisphaera sp.]|uniref:hypothetical protein n=1 Tax=Paludisphaera sp. TaxID=2017432 RepID=UPI00301BB7A1
MPASPIAPLRPIALALTAAGLLGSLPPTVATAQEAADAPAAAPAPPPGPAFAARERLIAFVEFDGLDAHDDAWRQTAAHRMLNDTSLGAMLEQVGVSLLDRASTWLPNRKINGADGVAIVKHLARKGFVAAFHADPSAPKGFRGVLILRGAATKEEKSLLGRLVVSFMDPASKHRLERKGTRSVVIVPPPGDGKPADEGWAWWAEGGDIGIALARPSDADACLASVDGKVESAVGHETVTAVAQPDAGLTPALKFFLDAKTDVKLPGSPATPPADSGIQRIEYRWGFQDEALVGATRIVAAKPRQGALAFLDDPSFEAKNVLPLPDGVEHFVSISLKPERWASLISGMFQGSPEARARYDAMVEGVRTRGRSDFEADFLGNIGPRVVAYIAPGTSAATGDQPAAPNMADPMALLSAMGPQMPRPVVVAEVADPAKFSRALEAVMQEVNAQLKAASADWIAAAKEAQEAKPGGPGAGLAIGPAGPGGQAEPDRKDRKRDEDLVPEFRLLTSTGAATNRTYMLNIPTASPLKLPAGFRPSVRLDGKHLAISTSSEAARVAVEQLRDKDWTPGEEIAQAIGRAPDSTILLFYGDFREATSTALAGLPGAIQSGVNTALAASEAMMNPQAAANQPGSPGFGAGPGGLSPAMAGSSSSANRSFGGMSGRGSDSAGSPPNSSSMMMMGSGGPGGPGSQGQPNAQAGSPFAAIQVRVDPANLPDAEELKAMMFPSTTIVSVEDDSIRIVTRGSFPDALALVGSRGFLPALLTPMLASARAAAAAKAAEAEAAAPAGQPGQQGQLVPPGQPGIPGQPGQSGGVPGQPGSVNPIAPPPRR